MEEDRNRELLLTVKETARLSGVSVRTLHYYDEIGLLRPAEVTQAGYRLYGERELLRLQQILLFRELEFPLKEIMPLLEAAEAGRNSALERQKSLLELKRERLSGLIRLVENLMKGERNMNFEAFDKKEYEARRDAYAEEARERWGDTEAYRESQRRTAAYKDGDWTEIQEEMEGIFQRFADCMDQSPEPAGARGPAGELQAYLSRRFYLCTPEILSGLGEMYAADQRFRAYFDKIRPGLADYVAEALKAYAASL